MKSKKKISLVSIVLLAMIAVTALYYFIFFVPAQTDLQLIKADTLVYTAEASLYETYIEDPSSLEEEISLAQAELDDLWNNGFTNESTVNLVIGDAIQRFNVSLTSLSLSEETKIDEYNALPINLVIAGSFQNVVDFISHFENHSEGSYLVYAASLSTNGSITTASIVIHLCTPSI